MSATASLTKDVKVLVVMFVGSGVIHLLRPQTYEPIMPRFVPAKREVIYASGVLELLCAAGLLRASTRRAAGWGSLALLVGVYPANFKMAGDALKSNDRRFKTVALGRLPLQLPLIRAALKVARGS